MLAPIKWMKNYVNIDLDAKDLADKITLTGSHVDSIIDIEKDITNVVTGRIIDIQQHPNADKLIVTKIDIGTEIVQIVTGAKNVSVGDIIPVSLIGAHLPIGLNIKLSKLRGIESQGMMCSYEELGFDEKVTPKGGNDGIMILEENTPIGKDIKDVLGINGKVLDIEITYNRPDCLNVTGMAREVAATLNEEFRFPEIKIQNEVDNINDYFDNVKIEAEELCDKFCVRVIKNIKIGKSPMWMQRALMDAGMRPVNNIVDVTNYVMLELGQPLHAYDLNKFDDKTIIARRAENGEILTTLDNVNRKLDENILVISNTKRPVGIAGVMGGFDTEIDENTTMILLESACFNNKSIRETSRKIGLRSEASARNEKVLHYKNAEIASVRACQLIEMIGAGTVVKGYLNAGKEEYTPSKVSLRPSRVKEILGVEIPVDKMIESLNKLELTSSFDGEKIETLVPYFRCDILQEIDLIEEIGRMYGFENIIAKPIVSTLVKGKKSKKRVTEDYIKSIMVSLGLVEIMTYSFISPKSLDKLCIKDDSEIKNYIKLINPLGEDFSVMRTTLMSNMLDAMSRNNNRGISSVKFFEVGNTFFPKQIPVVELPIEKSKLCIGMYGEYDFFNLKGIIEQTLERFGIKLVVKAVKDNPTFHGGICAGIFVNNEQIGVFGELHPEVEENYSINKKVLIAEIDVEKIVEYKNIVRKFKALPKYPAMQRDIAVTVKEDILVGDMQDVILKVNPRIIEDVKLFDVYQGEHIEKGFKSTAFSITYRNKERTLKDKEVDKIHNRILQKLNENFDAVLR
ncbi:phenylalanine--tRNA ligase subunit beta [Sedimentibacter sp. zth1]|uniref:phenylalanine--tRNA ligase subunit beta n=1 Tax=Sedimentibacter sp. zth1 TaxID=2816908 RepID=UPI001A9178FB|nr:phenylalanine--tRNA ligase subunit beta [Sedimentibacter sp. zth1]QSX06142.1 phenylalanine--tRNA ligase subunit beta [Sedimentibacter sp. zth1]